MVVFEGVNVLHFGSALDLGVYVDAAEPDMRRWFVEPRARAAAPRPPQCRAPPLHAAFARRSTTTRVAAMAVGVWEAINLPNLRDYVEPTRDRADVVVVKGPDHAVAELRLR